MPLSPLAPSPPPLMLPIGIGSSPGHRFMSLPPHVDAKHVAIVPLAGHTSPPGRTGARYQVAGALIMSSNPAAETKHTRVPKRCGGKKGLRPFASPQAAQQRAPQPAAEPPLRAPRAAHSSAPAPDDTLPRFLECAFAFIPISHGFVLPLFSEYFWFP